MKSCDSKFDFIINTIPTIPKDFGKYMKSIAKGGIIVQVGQPDLDYGKIEISVCC